MRTARDSVPPPPPPPMETIPADEVVGGATLPPPPSSPSSSFAYSPSLLIIAAILAFVIAASASIHLLLRLLSRPAAAAAASSPNPSSHPSPHVRFLLRFVAGANLAVGSRPEGPDRVSASIHSVFISGGTPQIIAGLRRMPLPVPPRRRSPAPPGLPARLPCLLHRRLAPFHPVLPPLPRCRRRRTPSPALRSSSILELSHRDRKRQPPPLLPGLLRARRGPSRAILLPRLLLRVPRRRRGGGCGGARPSGQGRVRGRRGPAGAGGGGGGGGRGDREGMAEGLRGQAGLISVVVILIPSVL
ncbi:hypothetical protein J5N97_001811 [Dioscorea zingiberensis]|uniref:Uncharacterized protein n=1 Tax=Dioscorea zingiberensis TaxID=325984 RepID=A0A9D5H223_9LILI|nr:hypothetical protein J5N97_001811 [Dioscorea zingiberensis]